MDQLSDGSFGSPCSYGAPILLSDDGYVRLSCETLWRQKGEHFLSGLDDDFSSCDREGACLVDYSGYTEWLISTSPVITFGWDWQLDLNQGRLLYSRLGDCRSNVMLVDDQRQDFGVEKTSALMAGFIETLPWRETLRRELDARYV